MTTASTRQRELPELSPLIHQALLDPFLEEEDLFNLCDAGRMLSFGALCTSLCHLERVRDRIGPSGRLRLIAVVAFPFGTIPAELKRAQAFLTSGPKKSSETCTLEMPFMMCLLCQAIQTRKSIEKYFFMNCGQVKMARSPPG